MKTGILLSLMMLSINLVGQNKLDTYKIFNTRTRSLCTIDEVVQGLESSHVVLFGEEHNDSIGHFLEDTLYTMMLSRYHDVTLSLEMFERDAQIVIDEYLADHISESSFMKESRVWKNYSDYKNLVYSAKRQKQKVVAANAPRRYVSMVNRRGLASLNALTKESRQFIAALPIDTVNTAYREKFIASMGGQKHFSGLNMYYAQVLWDATMAESIYNARREHRGAKVFHLNGKFHSDERLGVVSQLQRMDKKAKITTISCFPADDFALPDWSKYEKLADFVIITDPKIEKTF